MHLKKLLFVFVVAAAGLRSQAQTNTIYLTLDSAIQMSLQQSKQLRIDSSKIQAARARYQQAKTMELPTARLSAGYTRLSDNVEPYTILLPGTNYSKTLGPQIVNRYTPTLSASQTIYAGGQIKYAERSMKLLEEASRLDLENNKTAIVYNTTSAYFNLYTIQQTKNVIEEDISQVKDHVKDIKNYEKNGIALKNDVLKIELQLSDLEHSLIEVNSAIDIAEYNMSITLGLPSNSRYQLSEKDIDRAISLKTIDEYQTEALAHRADLKAYDKKIGAAILGVKSTAANYLPTLNTTANYYYNRPNARVFPQEDAFKATWDAGITLSWNIHSLYTNKHKIAESKANLSQTMTNKEKLTDDIAMEVNTNYVLYVKNQQRIRVSEQAVKQAEENYRIINNRFRNNTVLISDLTDANTLLLQSRINLLVDKADATLSYYKLLQSTGSNK